MTILTFVFSILIVLSVVTYSKIEQFKSLFFTETLFVEYMQEAEINHFNEKNINLYKETIATQKENEEQISSKTAKGSSTLSLFLFFNPKDRLIEQSKYEALRFVFKNLLETLYSTKKFYKDFIEEEGSKALDSFIDVLMQEGANKNFDSIEEVGSLDLQKEDMNLFLFYLFKGNEEKEKENQKENYPSITSFLNLKKQHSFRVYLLKKPLLTALFPEEITVKEILSMRKTLYNELTTKDTNIKAEELTARFSSEFSHKAYPEIPSTLLDFTVSKTKPPN